MCCICNSVCCKTHFPEWARETSKTLFCIKLAVVAIITAVILTVEELEFKIFSGSNITWASAGVVLIYGILLGFLFVLYWPYQRVISPLWVQIIVFLIWFAVTTVFFLNGWLGSRWWKRPDIQNDWFDYWTIGHALSGIVLGFIMPWWQTFFMLVFWEVVERHLTVGLGDTESYGNQGIDIVVAVIGWWLVILLFSRSRRDIPWISSRNSLGNEGKCCFEIYVAEHVQQSSYEAGVGQTYSTVHV